MGNTEEIRFGVVTTKTLLEAVQRFRYQVYVKECGFEPASEHPTGLESDLWDARAVHMAALDGAGEVVGCLRLILESSLNLPLLKATSGYYEKPLDKKRVGEVSRFAVHRAYRHVADGRTDVAFDPAKAYVFHRDENRFFPSQRRRQRFAIILGLFRTLYRVSNKLGVKDWYLMAEKPLWYFLRRYHILIQAIGPEMDFHGPRSPYVANVSTVENNLLQANPTMIHSFMDSLTVPIPPLEDEAPTLEFPVPGMTYEDLLQPSEPSRPRAPKLGDLGNVLWPTTPTPVDS